MHSWHLFRVVWSVSKLVLYCHIPLVVGFGEEGKNLIVLKCFFYLFCGPCMHCNTPRLFRVTNFCSGSTPLSFPSTVAACTPTPPVPLSLALNHLWLRDMYLLRLWIDPDDNFPNSSNCMKFRAKPLTASKFLQLINSVNTSMQFDEVGLPSSL